MPRRAVRGSLAAGALAVLAGLLAGCTAAPPVETPTPSPTPTPVAASGDGVLRIGTLFPAGGALAFLAPAQVAGVNAAVREINAAGGVNGVPVEVLSRDSGDATTQVAESSFADFVNRTVDAVVGPSSSAIAERLLPLAADAAVPIVSPSATFPALDAGEGALDGADWFFRTIGSYPQQAAAIAPAVAAGGAGSVVLVHGTDAISTSIVDPFAAAAEAAGLEASAVPADGDAAEVAAAALADDPDAVVLATPDNGAGTLALIGALRSAGLAAESLWLTTQNSADYSQALPAGTVAGAHGVVDGTTLGADFAARVLQEDPGVTDLRYAAEAYDAVVLIALAAAQTGDDGGASIASALTAVSSGGVKCLSYGECLAALEDGQDIDYDGLSGDVDLGAAHRPAVATSTLMTYGPDNRFAAAEVVTG